jgi:hypothetical protein
LTRTRAGTVAVLCAALLIGLWENVAAPRAMGDPGSVAPDQRFLADVMSYMIPPWPSDETTQLGHRVCADMAKGVSADAERNTLVMDLLRQGIQASNAQVGTMVHLAVQDLCPQIPYR